MFLSFQEKLLLKKTLKLLLKILIFLLFLGFLTYSCDWDFPIRVQYLQKTDINYPEGMTEAPVQQQSIIQYKGFNLIVLAQVQLTGNFYEINPIRGAHGTGHFKKWAESYNDNFHTIFLLHKNDANPFVVVTQKRLINQLFSKLEGDETYPGQRPHPKITLIGYKIKLQGFPEISTPYIFVNKVIFNGKIFQ